MDLWLGIDSDNDGLPDEWEWNVVASDPTGMLQDISQVNPNDDLSGNGMTNLDKFLTGVYALELLDGLNFRIDSVTKSGATSIAKLHFQAITGRTYHISASDDLQTWTKPQPFSIVSDGTSPASYYLAPDVRVLNIFVDVTTNPKKFFKLYAE